MHQRVANTDLLNYNFGKVEHWPPSTAGIVVFLFLLVIVILILLAFVPAQRVRVRVRVRNAEVGIEQSLQAVPLSPMHQHKN